MISRLVLDAFRRLAGPSFVKEAEEAVIGIAAEVAAEVKESGASPSGEQTSKLFDALADSDPAIRAMRESARGDDKIRRALRDVIADILKDIARGAGGASAAITSSDATRLVNYCRMLLSKAEAGEDRKTKSRGFKESLLGFADRLKEGGKALGDDVVAFVREAFSGELPGLVNGYLYSRPRGNPSTKGSMLAQQAGGGSGGWAAARKQAESQVLALLYESIMRRAGYVRAGTYDMDLDDEVSFTAVVSSLYEDIRHNKIDDQFAPPKTGLETPQAKWRRYVEPLRGTDMFGADRPDLGAILDWINANFHREDLASQEPVTAALPGGGSITAPSFKRELTMDGLSRWYRASQGISSLDAPLSEDGGTVGESVGRQDKAVEDREEYKTEYLSDPENNARIRRKLEAVIHEAAATVPVAVREKKEPYRPAVYGIQQTNLRRMYEIVLLIKLGFASKPAMRKKFELAWREGGAIVNEDGDTLAKGSDVPHIPFRTELIKEELWRKLGRPKRKGWEQDRDQSPHKRYRFPWTQKVLVRRDTGEPLKDIRGLHDDKNPEHWKIIGVKHTTAEEPKPGHFMNWVPYTEEDRAADIKKTLDAYDGDEWFRMSLRPKAQQALKESLDEGDPLRNFKPEDVFSSFAKNVDWPMFRAMGQTRLSVTPQTDSLYHGLSGPAFDMKVVMRELVTVIRRMEESGDPDAPWIFTYMAQKRVGKVSRRRSRPRVAWADIESVTMSVVDNLLSS